MARKQQSFGRPPAAPDWQHLKLPAAAPRPAADPLAATYQRGLELHRAGKLTEAGLAFQQVLAASPRHPDASHSLALVHHQMGKSEIAERLLRRAIEDVPGNPVFHSNLGMVLLALSRPAEAAESYRRALRIDPEAAALHAQLGVALLELGRAADAAQAELRALRLRPNYAMALANLGRAQAALGRRDEAVASFSRAVALQPGLADAHVWWGDLLAPAAPDAAAEQYRAAVVTRPEHAGAHIGLAVVLSRLGQHQAAADNFKAAAYLEATSLTYLRLAREWIALDEPARAIEAARMALRLGDASVPRGEIEAALAELGVAPDAIAEDRRLSELERDEAQKRIAVEATPDNPVALGNLGSALGALGRQDEAVAYYRQALALDPDYFQVWSAYLFAINYLGDLDVETMTAEARRYGERVAARFLPRADHPNLPDAGRRLRVGLLSSDLHGHPVGRFLAAVVAAIDAEQVELFAYHNASLSDGITDRLRASIAHWQQVDHLSDDDLAARIASDRIDILVDLNGHSANNRLLVFARKPAPVAVSWIGYFATTGLTAIDYVLATPWVIPDEERWQWVEQPWHLPETYLCFSPPQLHVPVVPPPALANGFITFGSANNINKLNDRTARCWAEILRAVPGSKLRLRSRPLADPAVAAQVRARFAALDIGAERLVLDPAENDYGRHLSRYGDVDIALDPFPYAGGTTTVEALWMGVPVLTLKGDRYVAHMGENILHNMQMPDWIATGTDDYVQKAAAYASDAAVLAALRQDLRHRLATSPLYDAPRFARHLEAAFRGMWHRWCESAGAR